MVGTSVHISTTHIAILFTFQKGSVRTYTCLLCSYIQFVPEMFVHNNFHELRLRQCSLAFLAFLNRFSDWGVLQSIRQCEEASKSTSP